MRPEYHCAVLPNGLRVVTVEMPGLHAAEMLCYVGVGSRAEAEESAGISHFLEHMLFRGTADYPRSRDLEAAFEEIGGLVNASTDAETTCYHTRFHPEQLERCAALFASMLRRPLLEGIDVERRIIIEEALEDCNEAGIETNPDNLTSRLLWPGHPLSRPTLGQRETLQSIDRHALVAHLQTYYTPGNTVIAVAGAVGREAVDAAVTRVFGDWCGPLVPEVALWSEPEISAGPESVWVRESDSQIAVQIAFRLPGRNDPRQMQLRFLRRILSGSGTARLMLRLREELGLTYNIEANLSLFADSGCLAVDLAVAPENLVVAVDETLQVLQRLTREALETGELERIRRGYLYDLDFSCDHADEMATRYGWGTLAGALRTLESDRKAIAAISAGDLLATARDLFHAGVLRAAFVGPWKAGQRRAVEKLLAGYGRD